MIIDQYRKRGTVKRGGHQVTHVNFEGVLEVRPADSPSPEETLLLKEQGDRLQNKLRSKLSLNYQSRNCRLMEAVVFDGERPCDLARASRGTLSAGAAYVALHRMRRYLEGYGRESLLS